MKAYEIRDGFGIDQLKLVDRPRPEPGPKQVLVRVHATSLNYRDLMMVTGRYNPRLPLPCIPLSDGAGVIEATGEGTSLAKPGDRVAGLFAPAWLDGELTEAKRKSSLGAGGVGMLSEYVVLPETGVIAIPDHLSFEEAATLPCAAVTAWNALFGHRPIQPGETVLVQGTGGVSVFALQFAKLAGARVLATSSSDAKLERVRAMGADMMVNYKSDPDWEKRAIEWTAGQGVDHIVEVGGAGTLGRSLKAVRISGQISLIGVLAGTGDVNPTPALMKAVTIRGIYVGSGAQFAAMNAAIAAHKLRPVIDRVFEFDDAISAWKHLEAASHFGKVVIRA